MTKSPFVPTVRGDVTFLRTSRPSVLVACHGESRHELYELEGHLIRDMDGTRDVDALTQRAQSYFPGATRSQVEKIILQAASMGLLSNLGPVTTSVSEVSISVVAPPSPDDNESEPWIPERNPWYRVPWVRKLLPWAAFAFVLAAGMLITYPRYVTDECLVMPLERREVRAEMDGILAEILVDEGARVKAGDVIARFEGRDVDAAWSQAKAEVDRLTANVDKMRFGFRKEEIARTRAALSARFNEVRFARLDAEREEKLFSANLSSLERRDASALRLQLARKAWAQTKADFDLIQSGYRPEDIKLAEAELARATIEVAHLEAKRLLTTIRSPIDGQIVTANFRERLHEKVDSGGTICEVADTRTMRVETFIPEREVDVVSVGQPMTIKVEGYPLHPFTGQVAFISPAVQERAGRRVIRVVTEIENSEGLLRPEMTGYGEIHTGRRPLLDLAFRRLVRWVRLRFLI